MKLKKEEKNGGKKDKKTQSFQHALTTDFYFLLSLHEMTVCERHIFSENIRKAF